MTEQLAETRDTPVIRTALGSRLEAAREFWNEHRQRLRTFGLVFAVLVFGAGLFWSVRELAETHLQFRILPCVLLVTILLPLGLIGNAAGFRIVALMAGTNIGWGASLRTIIFARAANFLPIPAGFATRVAALRVGGVSLRLASYLTLVTTGLWGALAFGFAGLWLVRWQPVLAAIFAVVFVLGVLSCAVGFRTLKVRPQLVIAAAVVRLLALVQEALCIVAAFHAIGTPADFQQSAPLVVSTFLSTAMSIFPDGLGLREGLAMLLAPLAGLDSATGFLATSVLRGLGLGVLLIAAGVAYLFMSRKNQ